MGNQTIDIDEKCYEMAKGHFKVGDLNMMWDFTGGLSQEQWVKSRKVQLLDKCSMFVLKNGRIIMPLLDIY